MHGLVGTIALGWALVVGTVELEAARRFVFARLRRERARSSDLTDVRVLVIRPCAGCDPWLGESLRSIASARCTAAIACRIAIADASDAAHPTGEAAASALMAAGLDARVVLTAPRAPNRKAAQIAAAIAAEAARFDAVLVADGDVDLAGIDLDILLAPLFARHPEGAVWAPPVEVGREQTLGDRASASLLGASLHAFPILARLDRGGLVGKLFAVRRDALESIGGFAALTSHLGEDMELARLLRARGHAIAAAPIAARSLSSGRTWEQAEDRFGRWLKVIRAQRPLLLASYPLLFLATLPLLALAAITALSAPRLALAIALIAVATRAAVALAAGSASGRTVPMARLAVDVLLADALLTGAFVRALRSRHVVWRDVALTIDRGGLLRAPGDWASRSRVR